MARWSLGEDSDYDAQLQHGGEEGIELRPFDPEELKKQLDEVRLGHRSDSWEVGVEAISGLIDDVRELIEDQGLESLKILLERLSYDFSRLSLERSFRGDPRRREALVFGLATSLSAVWLNLRDFEAEKDLVSDDRLLSFLKTLLFRCAQSLGEYGNIGPVNYLQRQWLWNSILNLLTNAKLKARKVCNILGVTGLSSGKCYFHCFIEYLIPEPRSDF